MNSEKKKCALKIDNIEPFFIWQFGINLPENLKPKTTTIADLDLSKDDWGNPNLIFESSKKLREINENESLLYDRYGLECVKKCAVNCRRFIRLEWDIEQLSKKPIDILDFNEYWMANPKITWLSNKSEKDKELIGLGANRLETIDEYLYQIGMQSTTTKEYFRYICTTEKRKVNIRMVLFNQYHKIQNLGNKSELADFFIRFNNFENILNNNYESMTFHLDEYGDRYFKLRTIEGGNFIKENFGFEVDFENWIKEIKAGQN